MTSEKYARQIEDHLNLPKKVRGEIFETTTDLANPFLWDGQRL